MVWRILLSSVPLQPRLLRRRRPTGTAMPRNCDQVSWPCLVALNRYLEYPGALLGNIAPSNKKAKYISMRILLYDTFKKSSIEIVWPMKTSSFSSLNILAFIAIRHVYIYSPAKPHPEHTRQRTLNPNIVRCV